MFQDEVVPLREEAVEEQLDLPTARQFLSAAVLQQEGANVEECKTYIEQLLSQIKRRDKDEFYEANMLLVFAKMLVEYGALPRLDAGTLLKDVFLTQEAAERLEDLQEQDFVKLYSLLQDSRRGSNKRFKRNISATSSQTTWAVRWIALLAKMACACSQQDTVEWTTVETRTKTWLNGVFYYVEIKAGLALAALDILDSATTEEPIVANVTITGLTPRRVFDMLQVPNVVDFALVQTAAPINKFQLLSQFTDVLLTFAFKHQNDEEMCDTARVCDALVRRAFQNTPSFLLGDLAKKKNQGDAPANLSSKKRKRLAETADPSSRMAKVLNPSYPFLVRIQVKLANDNRTDARNVANEMERCSAIKEEDKMMAWCYIMDHFRSSGDLFLDGNHVKSNVNAYLKKRTELLNLRRFMGELGLDTMIDWYKQLSDEVNEDPLTTPAEKDYVKLASQHTVLKLLVDKFGDAAGVKRMLDEYPALYIWKEGGDTLKWAWNFLTTSNPIPKSLLLENGQVDMQSLWNRAPPHQPVAAIEEEQVEVIVEPENAVEEQAIVEPPPPQQQQQEARPAPLGNEEIALSSDDDEQDMEEENVRSEDQDMEEIFESDDDVEEGHAYNSYDDDEEEGDEFDDYMLEQQRDGAEPGGFVHEQREQPSGEQVVDLLDSSTEEESPSSEQDERVLSDGTQEFEQPAARPAREYQADMSDEEEVDATLGPIQREAEDATRPEPIREAVDDYDEEDAYDSQEDGVPDGNNVLEVESSPQEEYDWSEGEEVAERSAVETLVTSDGEAKEGIDNVAERSHIDTGYEPDTTGQTEEEDDDDKKLSASSRSSFPRARSLIASRQTLSDMDAADERTEPSDVEDQGNQERRSLASQVASSLIEHVQDARRDSPSSYQADQYDDSTFHRPVARPQFQAERWEEDNELPIVDEVPKIDDVDVGDDATNETVGPSVAFSDSRAEEIPLAGRSEEAAENVVDHVPTVDDARDGDDTSAAFAASETGKYLSEANTEQPEESMETRVLEEPSKPVAKDIQEKKSTRKGIGNETDVGYMGDIEERSTTTTNAAATTAAFSMQGPGYEADVEERSVLKSSPTARALPTGLEMGGPPGEDDSIVVHPTDDSVSGFSVTGTSNIRSTPSEVNDTEDALQTDSQDGQPEGNDADTVILATTQELVVFEGREMEENKPFGEETSSPKPEEEKHESQSPPLKPSSQSPVKGASKDSGDGDTKQQEERDRKQQTPSTSPQATNRPSVWYGSPASHTRSHDPPVETEEQTPRRINRPSDWYGSPADHTRSHDPPVETDDKQSVSESTESVDEDDGKNKSMTASLAGQSKMDQQTEEEAISKQASPPTPSRSTNRPSYREGNPASRPKRRSPGRPRKNPLPEPLPAAPSSPNKRSPGRPRKKSPTELSPASSHSESVSSPKKRGPGRPRKSPLPEASPAVPRSGSVSSPKRRGPGRPRKSPLPEPSPAASHSESVSSPKKRGPGRPRKSPLPEASPAVRRSGSVSSPKRRGPGRPRKSPLPEPSPAASHSESVSSPKKRGPGRPRKSPLPEASPAASYPESVSSPNKRSPGRPRKSPLPEPSPAASLSESVSSPKRRRPGRPRTNPTLESTEEEAPETAAVESQMEVPTTPTRSSRNSVGFVDSPSSHLRSHASPATAEATTSQKKRRGKRDKDQSAEKATSAQSKAAEATPDSSLGSVPKKRRGRPPKNANTQEDDKSTVSSSTRRSTRLQEKQISPAETRKRRGRPKKADDDDTTTESPPKKRRGRPKKNPEQEEAAKSPPKKRRGRPKKADDDEGTTESPPKKRRGRPKKNPEQEEAAKSPPKKRRGRPPKVQKEEASMEDEESAATTARRSSRLQAKKTVATQPARRTRSRRSNSNAEEEESDEEAASVANVAKSRDPDDDESDDDEVNSQASTRKSRQPTRKGKKKANADRESLGSIPQQVAEGDGGSVSSMGSSSVASKRARRTTRATAPRDSLSTIAESPTGNTSSTTRTRSRTSAAKKASPAKRKASRSAKGSASSVASTSSRTTRSSYNLRGKK